MPSSLSWSTDPSTYFYVDPLTKKRSVHRPMNCYFSLDNIQSVNDFRELQLLFQEVQDLEHAILYLAHAHHRFV
jgi:hypothetical protein